MLASKPIGETARRNSSRRSRTMSGARCPSCRVSVPSLRPGDEPPGEGVQYHRQIDELCRESNAGDVCHPELVDAGQHHRAPGSGKTGRL
jgi:hypothetical protein